MLDLAQLAWTFDDACGWLTQACGRRLTTAAKLERAQQLRKKIRWRHELEDVLKAAADGIHSALEYRYLRDVERAHGLPRSRHQVRAVIDGKTVYRDAYYEKYKLATELDGKLAHPDQERWRDSHRPGTDFSAVHPARTEGAIVASRSTARLLRTASDIATSIQVRYSRTLQSDVVSRSIIRRSISSVRRPPALAMNRAICLSACR